MLKKALLKTGGDRQKAAEYLKMVQQVVQVLSL